MKDLPNIREILLAGDVLSTSEVEAAERSIKGSHESLVEYLLKKGVITKRILGQAVAESFGTVYADLLSNPPSLKEVLQIPESVARKFNVVYFSSEGDKIIVATPDPKQPQLKEELEKVFLDKDVEIFYCFADEVNNLLMFYKKPLEMRLTDIVKSNGKIAPEVLVEIIDDALSLNATDIHLEGHEGEVCIRLRIDGVLHKVACMTKAVYENILNRIKVQAHLRIDEHFAVQDGSIRFLVKDREVDTRISIVPTLDGEKVVIRLLGEYVRNFTLVDLGISEANQGLIMEAAIKPFGMILIAGPTGSGKTTTLYAVVKSLYSTAVNITTIEDPVEYRMPGVNQIQINPATNLTFAKGLKSIIRQDPDVILVGEIRDQETVEIAVNAALTGHLLLSSFHANDAPTAIVRLLEIGVEPFLLASTLELLISQRLIRKICEQCRTTVSIDSLEDKERAIVSKYLSKKTLIYKGKGCDVCGNTGYKGRTAVFEVIKMSPDLQDLILKSPTAREIAEFIRAQGGKTLFDDGIEKVSTGITTITELLRITVPPLTYGTKKTNK